MTYIQGANGAIVVAIVLYAATCAHARSEPQACEVRARTDAGWVCGLRRMAENGAVYASFRGVPYAKQPERELRFQELQPVEPWKYMRDATREGPICPQKDVLYGPLMNTEFMAEACIYANIHVPIEVLPVIEGRQARHLESPHFTGLNDTLEEDDEVLDYTIGRPILVFIHGGGFAFGSGDGGLYGPEYLVSKGVIVITFNYRLNVFGFLSLNSTSIPGNNGLRDQITLLRWVQKNARAFGGNPDDVTLGGQSAGASSAHLLSLSKAAEGLFRRVILMSGVADKSFFTTSPLYAQYISSQFVEILGINTTDPEEIHSQLIEMPLDKIMYAHNKLLDASGLAVFVPVVEFPHHGVTTIVEDSPDALIARGRGNHYPLIIGFTNKECESMINRFKQLDIVKTINQNPLTVLTFDMLFSMTPEKAIKIAAQIKQKYFNGNVTLNKFVKLCSDSYFIYPAIKLAQRRAESETPVFLYEFSYEAERSIIKNAFNITHKGAGHMEDMTFVFRANVEGNPHVPYPLLTQDEMMKDWMTMFVTNFMRCSDPTCTKRGGSGWPQVDNEEFQYQYIETPTFFRSNELTKHQQDMTNFFDHIYNES